MGTVLDDQGVLRAKPAAAWLLDHLDEAGIESVFWLLRAGKEDVCRHFQARHGDTRLAYLMVPPTPSAVHTLLEAMPFIGEDICALGYPDILFERCNAYGAALEHLAKADVVLGTFPTTEPERVDVVHSNAQGNVERIIIKEPSTGDNPKTWALAVWRPAFTSFLAEWLASVDGSVVRELFVGDALNAALAAGLKVRAVQVSENQCIDIGTPQGLARARQRFA